MSKKTKIAALAAAALALTAAPAAAEGYLGLEYGSGNIDSGFSDLDLGIWQGEAAAGFNVSPNWVAQVGGSFGNVEVDSGGDADFYTLNAHLFYRADAWRLGGVVALTSLDDSSGSIQEWAYGLEGGFDFGPNTGLVLSATAGSLDGDLDLWNLDAGLRHYVNPNWRIGGGVGVGDIDGLADTLSANLTTEFQPWSAPISINAGWRLFSIDDADLDASVFQIGGRWNFGGGTLQQRDEKTPFDTHTGYLNRLYGIY